MHTRRPFAIEYLSTRLIDKMQSVFFHLYLLTQLNGISAELFRTQYLITSAPPNKFPLQ